MSKICRLTPHNFNECFGCALMIIHHWLKFIIFFIFLAYVILFFIKIITNRTEQDDYFSEISKNQDTEL